MSEVLANGQSLASMLPYFSELELGFVKLAKWGPYHLVLVPMFMYCVN